MFQTFSGPQIKYRQIPFLALAIVPLTLISVALTGGGHAPLHFYLPYAVLFGPLAVLGFYIEPSPSPIGQIGSLLFSFFSPYPLYLFYGLTFVFLSSRPPTWLWRWLFVGAVLLVHLVSARIFLELGSIR